MPRDKINDEAVSRIVFRRGVCHTLDETARAFGVSRQRIWQIENRAIRKLREALAEKGFRNAADL